MAFGILRMKGYGDPSTASPSVCQLLTAKLNIAAGADGSVIEGAIGGGLLPRQPWLAELEVSLESGLRSRS